VSRKGKGSMVYSVMPSALQDRDDLPCPGHPHPKRQRNGWLEIIDIFRGAVDVVAAGENPRPRARLLRSSRTPSIQRKEKTDILRMQGSPDRYWRAQNRLALLHQLLAEAV